MASDRAALEAFFETSDVPTEGQYTELITSVPNIVDDYGSAPAFTRFVKVSLPAAQARNLNSTPQTLVAAPGAGFAIEAIATSIRLNFTAPVFTVNSVLNFTHASATLAQVIISGIFNSTISVFRRGNMPTFLIVDVIQVVEDEALILETSADSAAGGSSLDIYVMYRIITL